MEKEKISAFEFAILQQVDAEKAKEYEPYTEEETNQQRRNSLMEKASKLRILKPSTNKENNKTSE